jgi:hypothetical protein
VVSHHLDGLLRVGGLGFVAPQSRTGFIAFLGSDPAGGRPKPTIRWVSVPVPAMRCTLRRIPLVSSRTASPRPLPSCCLVDSQPSDTEVSNQTWRRANRPTLPSPAACHPSTEALNRPTRRRPRCHASRARHSGRNPRFALETIPADAGDALTLNDLSPRRDIAPKCAATRASQARYTALPPSPKRRRPG